MQASHINAQQGSLLLILGTTMRFGYGSVQTLCKVRTTRAQRAIRPYGKRMILQRLQGKVTLQGTS